MRFHLDDIIYSNMKSKVNDKFKGWMNRKYGKHGEVKANKGKVHDYLGMNFDLTSKGKLILG